MKASLINLFALAFSSTFLSSCAGPHPWKGSTIVYEDRQARCAMHKTPLEEKTVYQRPIPGCVLVDPAIYPVFQHFPNAHGGLFWDATDSTAGTYVIPRKDRYCPACQAEFLELLKRKKIGTGRMACLTF